MDLILDINFIWNKIAPWLYIFCEMVIPFLKGIQQKIILNEGLSSFKKRPM